LLALDPNLQASIKYLELVAVPFQASVKVRQPLNSVWLLASNPQHLWALSWWFASTGQAFRWLIMSREKLCCSSNYAAYFYFPHYLLNFNMREHLTPEQNTLQLTSHYWKQNLAISWGIHYNAHTKKSISCKVPSFHLFKHWLAHKWSCISISKSRAYLADNSVHQHDINISWCRWHSTWLSIKYIQKLKCQFPLLF
jgi:hypothetical protein